MIVAAPSGRQIVYTPSGAGGRRTGRTFNPDLVSTILGPGPTEFSTVVQWFLTSGAHWRYFYAPGTLDDATLQAELILKLPTASTSPLTGGVYYNRAIRWREVFRVHI